MYMHAHINAHRHIVTDTFIYCTVKLVACIFLSNVYIATLKKIFFVRLKCAHKCTNNIHYKNNTEVCSSNISKILSINLMKIQ